MTTKLRQWLHERGVHLFCRVRWEELPDPVRSVFGDYDVTNQSSYREVHG